MKMKKSGFAAFSLFSPRPSRSPGLPGGRRRARFPRPNVGASGPPRFCLAGPGAQPPGRQTPPPPRDRPGHCKGPGYPPGPNAAYFILLR